MENRTGVLIVKDVRADGLMPYLSEQQVEELKAAFIRDLTLSVKLSGMTLLGVEDVFGDFDKIFDTYFSEGYSRVLLVSSAAPFLTGETLCEIDEILATCAVLSGTSGEGYYLLGRNCTGHGEKSLPPKRIIAMPSDLGSLEKAIQSGRIFIPSTELFLETISCVGCGRCLKNCIMLKKHHVDLKDLAREDALMDECFLCGTCSDVCLSKIDGKRIVECLRRRRVLEKESVSEKASETHVRGEKTVFFPGCALTKAYPETLKRLEDFFAENDIDSVKACCMKTLYATGAYEKADRAIEQLIKKFEEKGTGEVVFACPDCYYFLRDRLPFDCVSVYGKMQELGFKKSVSGTQNVYVPCPDRKEKIFYRDAAAFSEEGFKDAFRKLQCCGGGGGVKNTNPDLATALSKKVNMKFYGRGDVTTLCGTCALNFHAAGKKDVAFFLSDLCGTEEL